MTRFKPTDRNIKTIIELGSKGVKCETIQEVVGASRACIRFYISSYEALIKQDYEEVNRICKSSKNPNGIIRLCEYLNLPYDFLEVKQPNADEQLTIVEASEPETGDVLSPILKELKSINKKLAELVNELRE